MNAFHGRTEQFTAYRSGSLRKHLSRPSDRDVLDKSSHVLVWVREQLHLETKIHIWCSGHQNVMWVDQAAQGIRGVFIQLTSPQVKFPLGRRESSFLAQTISETLFGIL